jgi:hypothetical protein
MPHIDNLPHDAVGARPLKRSVGWLRDFSLAKMLIARRS